MQIQPERILVVDDEKEIADLIEIYLKNGGYKVTKCYNAKTALQMLETETPDAAILDVMLPDMDGFMLCAQIRESHNFPIIMLTAKVEDADKITGLTIGADDYLTKPFNPMELLARIKAQLRRVQNYSKMGEETEQTEEYEFWGLAINKTTHTCTLYGKDVPLTPIEFSILWFLCQNRGKVVSSETLFENVWQEKYMDSNNTVMAHIARLREKLAEPPRNPKFIKTVWGVGYKIENGT
ncbi:VanR-ABDEGLN family response regulator transcription factor [Ruminococcaceae bacterium OttesenSCG-928-A16]|nr:VanR-ABDEGLN family response regulator transcription factor [Ruminococcaceae bacterium OttesenSCG-928-A16]